MHNLSIPRQGKKYNLLGMRFGKWTVTSAAPRKEGASYYHARWIVLCDCGNINTVIGATLRNGTSIQCRKCAGLENRIPDNGASFNSLYSNYKAAANRRGYSFDLTKEEFKFLTKSNCRYCGCPPGQSISVTSVSKYVYNGVDRTKNILGYTLSNCVPCCFVCNQAKHKMSTEEFLSWIERVYYHSTKA